MIQFFPAKIPKWINLKHLNLDSYYDYSSIGCSLKHDLDYPHNLYDLHNRYYLESEKIKVTEEMSLKQQL